jgi:predicted  nucleic acid-binding Zn-ribbon protein
VKETLEQLLAVQEHDRQIMRFEREMKDIPARKEDIREHVNDARQALEDAREKLKSATVKMKDIEIGVDASKDKISAHQRQESDVKTNAEYTALQREIFQLKQKIMKYEDDELVIMEDMEKMRVLIAVREEELTEQESHIQEDIDILNERMAELSVNLERLKKERAELVESIDPKWLARYERAVQHRAGPAIVSVEGKTCTGCHMALPPQSIQNVKRGQTIEICDFCGRFLCMPSK